jgi:hypothetical protein
MPPLCVERRRVFLIPRYNNLLHLFRPQPHMYSRKICACQRVWNKANPASAAEIFARAEGVERFVSGFLKSFPDLQHTAEEMIADGDRIAVRFSAKGTHAGGWVHLAPTGKSIQYTGDFVRAHRRWQDHRTSRMVG